LFITCIFQFYNYLKHAGITYLQMNIVELQVRHVKYRLHFIMNRSSIHVSNFLSAYTVYKSSSLFFLVFLRPMLIHYILYLGGKSCHSSVLEVLPVFERIG